MDNKNNIGIITEQGFVAGQGLGFNPININETKKPEENKDEKQG